MMEHRRPSNSSSSLLEKGQILLQRMNISDEDNNNQNNYSQHAIDDNDENDDDENNNLYDDQHSDPDENIGFEVTYSNNDNDTYPNQDHPFDTQRKRTAGSSNNGGSTRKVGVRKLGKQFKPEKGYVNIDMARKPGIVPKMWDPSEDELLRQAVKKHGERDWKKIAEMVPGRNHLQCLQRWNKSLKPGLIKGHWTEEEDNKLLELLKVTQNWQEIAAQIPGRNAKQCRERWFLNLDPSLKHGPWSPEEDELLLKLEEEHGGRWSVIAKYIAGRTENMVKSRFHTLQRQIVKERGWFLWEDRLIIEFCLTNGRQWHHLVKVLPGRSKGQIKKRYLTLMESFPDLGKMVEGAEANINNGRINVGAKEHALRMIPHGPPDQERQDDDEGGKGKTGAPDPMKEKTKSFRVLKPTTESVVQANFRNNSSLGRGLSNNNLLSSASSIPQGQYQEPVQNFFYMQQPTPMYSVQPMPDFHQYTVPNPYLPIVGANIPTQAYQIHDQQVTVENRPERKKLVHHKGSSWLEDVEVPEVPPNKVTRFDPLDHFQHSLPPPSVQMFAPTTLPSLSPRGSGNFTNTLMGIGAQQPAPFTHGMSNSSLGLDDPGLFLGSTNDLFTPPIADPNMSWNELPLPSITPPYAPNDHAKELKLSDSAYGSSSSHHDSNIYQQHEPKLLDHKRSSGADSLTRMLRGLSGSSFMNNSSEDAALIGGISSSGIAGYNQFGVDTKESLNSLRSNSSKELDRMIV